MLVGAPSDLSDLAEKQSWVNTVLQVIAMDILIPN